MSTTRSRYNLETVTELTKAEHNNVDISGVGGNPVNDVAGDMLVCYGDGD